MWGKSGAGPWLGLQLQQQHECRIPQKTTNPSCPELRRPALAPRKIVEKEESMGCLLSERHSCAVAPFRAGARSRVLKMMFAEAAVCCKGNEAYRGAPISKWMCDSFRLPFAQEIQAGKAAVMHLGVGLNACKFAFLQMRT